MLRQLIIAIAIVTAAHAAIGAEAGKIVFVAGYATIAERPAALGQSVNEGDMLSTGNDGYIYVKTVDEGLLILRPSTKARIAVYHIDDKNPANSSFKLELLSGIARSRSGHAVKLARQNFRFNTPVAAIGVRGTDFTVFTDQDTSRVAVVSGGITVSGFSGACRPEGVGPCEGGASRELTAMQKGQLLQVKRGQTAPQLLQSGTLAPDLVAPPRPDEPIGKNGSGNGNVASNGEPSLDPKKNVAFQNLQSAPANIPSTGAQTGIVTTPPEVVTLPAIPSEPAVPAVPVPLRQVSWGRWGVVADQPVTASLSKDGADRIAVNDYFVLFRDKAGAQWTAPDRGSVGFTLTQSEAYVRNQATQAVTMATLENGQLLVDFGKSSFSTSFDLLNEADRYKLQSKGALTRDGRLFGDGQLNYPSNMNVTGLINSDSSAIYLFQSSLPGQRTASGITVWGK